MKVRFDEEKALAVFRALEKPYVERTGIFSEFVLPQDRFKWETANEFFFLSLFERGGMISGDTIKFLWQLKQDVPELYDPKAVATKWSPDSIEGAFKAVAPKILNGEGTGESGAGSLGYKLKEHTQAWYRNSAILHKYWGNDIRNVFRYGVTEFEEAFRRVDYYQNPAGFNGMRRKIFSLLVIWLQEKNLIPQFPGPIPVDFHAMRVLWITDILKLNGLAAPFVPRAGLHTPHLKGKLTVRVSEKFMDRIAMWSQKFLYRHGMDHKVINPALWLLSRDMCAELFQNTTYSDISSLAEKKHESFRKAKEFKALEAELETREKGTRMRQFRRKKLIMKFVEAEKLRKNPQMWPAGYKDPCSHCPLEKWCGWSIPAAPYYTWGILVKTGPRVSYPVRYLPDMACPSAYRPQKRKRK